jgi:hypothetical protein
MVVNWASSSVFVLEDLKADAKDRHLAVLLVERTADMMETLLVALLVYSLGSDLVGTSGTCTVGSLAEHLVHGRVDLTVFCTVVSLVGSRVVLLVAE